jgi:hypothetical protein
MASQMLPIDGIAALGQCSKVGGSLKKFHWLWMSFLLKIMENPACSLSSGKPFVGYGRSFLLNFSIKKTIAFPLSDE